MTKKSGLPLYLSLMYNLKSELNHISSWEERQRLAAEKSGIEIPELKEIKTQVMEYLNGQHHDKYTQLIIKKHLLKEMMGTILDPVDTKDVDKQLKQVELKGKLDKLCDDLVMGCERLYKEIYVQTEVIEEAKATVAKSPEQRLKERNGI